MDKMEGQSRRPSLLERMHLSKRGKQEPQDSTPNDVADTSSQHSSSHLLQKLHSKPKRERKEKYSDSGPFIIEIDKNGVAQCKENNKWPPGVEYEIPNRLNKNQGLSEFYTSNNIAAGGEG